MSHSKVSDFVFRLPKFQEGYAYKAAARGMTIEFSSSGHKGIPFIPSYSEGQVARTWVGLTMILTVPPPCPDYMTILPYSHLPQQNLFESGTAKNNVNPTQVSDQMPHPQ